MSFDNSSIVWGASQLAAMVKNGRIVFDNIRQRGFVWEKSRKSKLIESGIIGCPIPPVYAKRYDDGSGKRNCNVYDILDGKQRLLTLATFIWDKFELTELLPVTFYDETTDEYDTVDISGMTFSELPEILQDKIKNIRINVVYFDNLTEDEEAELFKRQNNGKPLSIKSRTLASCKDIKKLLDIGSHRLFSAENGMITEKSIENKNHAVIVMKCWCMLNQDISQVSFESKIFNPLLEKVEVSDVDKLILNELFDLILDIHDELINRKEKKVARKLYTETHMVSLIPYFKTAIEDGINAGLFTDWLVDFFGVKDTASVSEQYNNACAGGSAKNVNILARHNALKESYDKFF